MQPKLLTVLSIALLSILLMTGVSLAQDTQPTPDPMASVAGMDSIGAPPACDVQTFMLQPHAYATALGSFEQTYAVDPDAALRSAYHISLAYQAFAEAAATCRTRQTMGMTRPPMSTAAKRIWRLR